MSSMIKTEDPGSIATPLRNVTHGLANAVGLLRTVSREFDKMSPEAAFLARGAVTRLDELLQQCTDLYQSVENEQEGLG